MKRHAATVAIALLSLLPGARGAAIPTECETPSTILDRLYSYFGGVASFTVATSDQAVYSAGSMALTINFQPSSFSTAGVAIGTLGVSAPALSIDHAADTFSITIKGPPTGTLKFFVLVREDDDLDGVINLGLGDEEWSSPELTIPAGVTTTFNIPMTDFIETGAGAGNGVQEFTTTTTMGMVIDIHSRASYPGGLLTTSRTLFLDHIGFFRGVQTAPPPCLGADFNADHTVNTLDLIQMLGQFGQVVAPGDGTDMNADGLIDTIDLVLLLGAFGTSCP